MKKTVTLTIALLLVLPLSWSQESGGAHTSSPGAESSRLKPPAPGQKLRVAFVLTERAVMIDFAGPWEVFQDVMLTPTSAEMNHPFELYTVSDSTEPIHASDGMKIVPDYTFDNAPAPNIVVIPAQAGRSPKMLDWVRRMTQKSDVVMSVCTGAFVLADAGLLNGKNATTHHLSYNRLHDRYPQITVERGMRYVQSDPVLFTAGGLSSGIDLALHIVDLYFGRQVAQDTANMMEYEGKGWTGDGKALAEFPVPKPVAYASDALTDGVLGRWEGTIHTSDGTFRVVLHIWADKDGVLHGAGDSVDDNAYGLALSSVSLRGNDFTFALPEASGSFAGKFDATAVAIRGTWSQHGVKGDMDLHRPAKPAETAAK